MAELKFIAVSRKKICEQITEQILQLIKNHKLKAGDQLPAERELAETLQVSRHSLREAIRIMEEKGLVKSMQGRGTFITNITHGQNLDKFFYLALYEKAELADIFEFRTLWEAGATRLAVTNISEEDLTLLQDNVKQQEVFHANGKSIAELDYEFHHIIAAATGNKVIIASLEKAQDILRKVRMDIYQTPQRVQASIEGHKKIVAELSARNPEKAFLAMKDHLNQIEDTVLENIVSVKVV